MKKVIKSYAEKICSRSLISDIKIEELKSKEPELFLNDNIKFTTTHGNKYNICEFLYPSIQFCL